MCSGNSPDFVVLELRAPGKASRQFKADAYSSEILELGPVGNCGRRFKKRLKTCMHS